MEGQCLCGAIVVKVPDQTHVDVCHCGMCRRWGGGPMMAVHCDSEVEITGQDKLRRFRSSDWAERVFCGECGTHIYYHLLSTQEYAFTAGLFQEHETFKLTSQIFIDKKPGYYTFANDTETMTEQEVFSRYSVE